MTSAQDIFRCLESKDGSSGFGNLSQRLGRLLTCDSSWARAWCRSCGKTRELGPDKLCGAAEMEAFRELERGAASGPRAWSRSGIPIGPADSQGNGGGATFIAA